MIFCGSGSAANLCRWKFSGQTLNHNQFLVLRAIHLGPDRTGKGIQSSVSIYTDVSRSNLYKLIDRLMAAEGSEVALIKSKFESDSAALRDREFELTEEGHAALFDTLKRFVALHNSFPTHPRSPVVLPDIPLSYREAFLFSLIEKNPGLALQGITQLAKENGQPDLFPIDITGTLGRARDLDYVLQTRSRPTKLSLSREGAAKLSAILRFYQQFFVEIE